MAITFGPAHKYKIIESLSARSDVILENTAALFGEAAIPIGQAEAHYLDLR